MSTIVQIATRNAKPLKGEVEYVAGLGIDEATLKGKLTYPRLIVGTESKLMGAAQDGFRKVLQDLYDKKISKAIDASVGTDTKALEAGTQITKEQAALAHANQLETIDLTMDALREVLYSTALQNRAIRVVNEVPEMPIVEDDVKVSGAVDTGL
ncbi:MAG: hypothetical protein GY861_25215 [bacterium]|nr:hypothetical protein [bacterium]